MTPGTRSGSSPPLSSPASSPPSLPHTDDEKGDADYDPKAEAAMRKEEEKLANESQRRQKKGSMKARWDAATDQKNFDRLDWFMSQSKVRRSLRFHCSSTYTEIGLFVDGNGTIEASIGSTNGRNHSSTEAHIRRDNARLPARRLDLAYMPLPNRSQWNSRRRNGSRQDRSIDFLSGFPPRTRYQRAVPNPGTIKHRHKLGGRIQKMGTKNSSGDVPWQSTNQNTDQKPPIEGRFKE